MEAKPAQKYDPDLISAEQPVADAMAVKTRIEALIGELVEPELRDVRPIAPRDAPAPPRGSKHVDSTQVAVCVTIELAFGIAREPSHNHPAHRIRFCVDVHQFGCACRGAPL